MRNFYYGWVMVFLAALAMIGTMPGRTNFLGVISKPLIDEPAFQLTESQFTQLNFWAVMLGATLALPVGWLIDRLGVRVILSVVAMSLGGMTYLMSQLPDQKLLFLVLVLIRGLGQGALSVVALAMVGKWFTRRIGLAMGLFTVLLTFGFVIGAVWLIESVKSTGWREPWKQVGFALMGLGLIGALFTRNKPNNDAEMTGLDHDRAMLEVPTAIALRSRAFWVFSLSGALFLLTYSAITLLPEQLLLARGFPPQEMKQTLEMFLGILTVAGLPANLLGGWLARKVPLGKLLAVGMFSLTLSLALFPFISTTSAAIGYAVLLGISGGLVTVVYFAAYGASFGRKSLGTIQAMAQVLTVFASAIGPLLLTSCRDALRGDEVFFFSTAILASLMAVLAWFSYPPQTELASRAP
jgi:MFS family permease